MNNTLDPKPLEAVVGTDVASEVAAALSLLPPETQTLLLHAGVVLADVSKKAASAYFRVASQVVGHIARDAQTDILNGWVGVGMQIARHSAALSIQYFREGPDIFSKIPGSRQQQRLIQYGRQVARNRVDLTKIYYQQAPDVLTNAALSEEDLARWVRQGLAIPDATLAVEYFKATPALLRVMGTTLLPKWIGVSQTLVKGTLYNALIFIRKSPEVFEKIAPSLHEPFIDLLSEVALQDTAAAIKLFEASGPVLSAFAPLHLASFLLGSALTLARFNAALAAAFFLSSPKVMHEMASATHRFPEWVERGFALLKQNPSGAESFFLLESDLARQSARNLQGGVFLSSELGSLQLYAQALVGRPIPIATATDETPHTDGKTLYLPEWIGHFPTDDLNRGWYRVATAFQAGFLEYGTFSPVIADIADLVESLQRRYHKRGGFTLSSFLALFPDVALAKRLFDIAEGARVASHLRQVYPGLRRLMDQMQNDEFMRARSLMGLSPTGAVVEMLRQISLAGRTREAIPDPFRNILFEACTIMGVVQTPEATVATSMKATSTLYDFLQTDNTWDTSIPKPMEAFEEPGSPVMGKGIGDSTQRLSTRGSLNPDQVETMLKQLNLTRIVPAATERPAASPREVDLSVLKKGDGRMGADSLDAHTTTPPQTFDYPEWDYEAQSYRPKWCRVIETMAGPKTTGFATRVQEAHSRLVQSVRRTFEHLRPAGLTWVKYSDQGDWLDWDAVVESRVGVRLRQAPLNHVYINRQRRERSVSAAFLIDTSGSTGKQLFHGKTVLQIAQESVVVLAQAVALLGDRFAIYGFSGRGHEAVWVSVFKTYEEPYHPGIADRIGGMSPGAGNRDGAAIRYVISRLAAEPSKIKLLLLISDGKPLDDGYDTGYALHDTKKALHEARLAGIHPYCVTVDHHGGEYLNEMYGEVAYRVIDRVEALPTRLAQVYRKITT